MNNILDILKLLDNGWKITLYKNQLGSYTSTARNRTGRHEITDHFTPEESLRALVEKVLDTQPQEWSDLE